MCGRYLFSQSAGEELTRLAAAFQSQTGEPAPQGDISPGSFAPVLLAEGICRMRWGYSGFSGRGLLINARAESAAQKPAFREAVRCRRCALPASGFYEWDARGQRYRFWLPQQPLFYMAGLWETFEEERRFVILTCAPNSSIEDIHNRMPVLLDRDQLSVWLREPERALSLLLRLPPGWARAPEENFPEQLSLFS